MIPANIDRQLLRVQKPARYAGGEMGSVMKQKAEVDLRFAFCFPDLYEVGMSHLGMKILYSLINREEGMWCERVFAPDTDFEAILRREGIPLYGLESFDPIREFDVIGFTLQYEMCYTTVLNMLDLAGLPVRSADRKDLWPLVIGGGPCACNPEPIADFFDLFQLGEGEELMLEMLQLCRQAKKEGWTKPRFLRQAAKIPGIYVPSLYDVLYNDDGTIQSVVSKEGAPTRVTKRIVKDLSKMYFPDNFVVPFTEVVHDRAMVEVLRGCLRGCRFCQAGYLYRPFREKDPEALDVQAKTLCAATGYEEVSLTSLSTSDHSRLEQLMERLLPWTTQKKVNIALPSLRVDNFSPRLLEMIRKVRQSGLTFAPEAGSQRLRDAINKNVTEEEVLSTARTAFEGGCSSMKLYFMMGLPTETMEDMDAIIDLAQKVVDLFYRLPGKPKGRGVQVTISVACFVPKPHTPFQFRPQDSLEEFQKKQKRLLETVTSRKIKVNYHDAATSRVEAILARGDRRLSQVVEAVWRAGGNLEGWDEHFSSHRWTAALAAAGLDGDFYACRLRPYDEILPWDHLDYGITKDFLIREDQKAQGSRTTENCRRQCSGCGANHLLGGACFEADESVL